MDNMGRFIRTLLIGIGIGLLIAPKRGEETRQLLKERFQDFRSRLPENIQQNPSLDTIRHEAAKRLSQAGDQLKQAAGKVK
jgi:gas vesicle protein